MVGRAPLIGLTARRLADGRVRGWQSGGTGEREAYMQRVAAAGGWPVLLEPVVIDGHDPDDLVARLDGVVLTGGPDVDPARYGQEPHASVYGTDETVDEFEVTVVRRAIALDVPLLAICRGVQVVNVALGGTLWQDIATAPGVAPHGVPGERGRELEHVVALQSGSRTATVMGSAAPTCSCHHHQSIDRLGDGLVAVGTAADGIVEAVELPGARLLGVQWHPEDTAPSDPAQQALFDWLTRQRRH